MSRIALTVSVVLGLAFATTLFADDLPMPVRSWIAETLPGGRELADLPPEPGEGLDMLIDRMALTGEGRRVFLSARPVVVDDLGELCGEAPDAGEGDDSLVTLGCYRHTDRIFLLRGDGPFGNAMTLTTAAHELLHAAYARLTDSEKQTLGALLTVEVARLGADDPVLRQIDASVGDDERSRVNEQFAYLGSQVVLPGGFSEELEAFYARWMSDRDALARSAG